MTRREERRQGQSSGEVRRNRGRDGREPDDGNLAKCGSPRGDLVQPRGGEDGGARGRLGDTQRRGEARRRAREKLAELSATMAMAFPPSGSREREGESGRVLASAGCHGVHDSVDNLTSGASAGVQSPNGSQVLRWSATMTSTVSIQTLRYLCDRATSTLINSQTVAN